MSSININNNINNMSVVGQEIDHSIQIKNPMSLLPKEIVLEIFSYLNVATLGKVSLVCKEWKLLINNSNLLKTAIYKEIAFGNDKWVKYFGKDVIKDEDNKEDFSSMPLNEFIEDCKKFRSIFPEKNPKDNLLLIRLPKSLNGGLTINSLGNLTRKYFSANQMGFKFLYDGIVKALGDKSIDKSRWVIMTKDMLPESRGKNFAEQKTIVDNLAQKALIGYEVPGLLESSTCILAHYFDTNERLFSDLPFTYFRCKEENSQHDHIFVGGFTSGGLAVLYWDTHKNVGVAPIKKF